MKARLKKGTVITITPPSGSVTLDESVVFTDNIEKGTITLLKGKRVYFPIDYNFPECGVAEDLLDIIEE